MTHSTVRTQPRLWLVCAAVVALLALAATPAHAATCRSPAGTGYCQYAGACRTAGGKPYWRGSGARGCAFESSTQMTCCYVAPQQDTTSSVRTEQRESTTHVVSPLSREHTRACTAGGRKGFCTRSHRGCDGLGGTRVWRGGGATGCDFDAAGRTVCCVGGGSLEPVMTTVVVGTINNAARRTTATATSTSTSTTTTTSTTSTTASATSTSTTSSTTTATGEKLQLHTTALDAASFVEPSTGVWVAKEDPESGNWFFWNSVEKRSTWTLPQGVDKVYTFAVYRDYRIEKRRLQEEVERLMETHRTRTDATSVARSELRATSHAANSASPRGAKRLAGRPQCKYGGKNGICVHIAECWDAQGVSHTSAQGASGCGAFDELVQCCTGDLKAPLQGSVGAEVEAAGCSTAVIGGLASQLAEALNCQLAEADKLVRIDNVDYVSLSPGAAVSPYLQKSARDALVKVTAAKKRTLRINSALRSLPQQLLLWTWKEACGYSKVATPGRSNHQGGIAIDVSSVSRPAYKWTLEQKGFKWYGAGDKPHFTYTAGKDLRSDAVLAFQRAFNANHATGKLAENGVWSEAVARAVMMSPVDGFAVNIANCNSMQTAALDYGTHGSAAISAAGEAVQLQMAVAGPLVEANVLVSQGVSLVEVASLETTGSRWRATYTGVASSPAAFRTAEVVDPTTTSSRIDRIGTLMLDPVGLDRETLGLLETHATRAQETSDALAEAEAENDPHGSSLASLMSDNNNNNNNNGGALMSREREQGLVLKPLPMRMPLATVPTKPLELLPRRMYKGMFKPVAMDVNVKASQVMRLEGFDAEGKLVYRDYENKDVGSVGLQLTGRDASLVSVDGVVLRLLVAPGARTGLAEGAPVRFYMLRDHGWAFLAENALTATWLAHVEVPTFVEGTKVFKAELPDGRAATLAHYCAGMPMFVVVDSRVGGDGSEYSTAHIRSSSPLLLHTEAAPRVRVVTYTLLTADGASTALNLGESADVHGQFELQRGAPPGMYKLEVVGFGGEGERIHGSVLRIEVTDEVTL